MSAQITLPFEEPVAELETKLKELEAFSQEQDIDVSHEIKRMQEKIEETRIHIYTNLTAWQKVQVARHPDRPYTMDYINAMTTDFVEIHGDRIHRDDRAIVGGFAKIDGQKVMIIGSQKGRDTKSNVECNFGCAHPEGYRKALRLMKLADKFGVPIITLIDTKGAYAGLESEERHIAEAIAVNLRESFNIKVPIICVIIGEGGSGGALGIGIGNRILILEHAYYSVISPEGCAAILWKDRAFSDKAAEALKITGSDLIKLNLADEVIPEPKGGAHVNHAAASANLKEAVLKHLAELSAMSAEEIMQDRYDKFRAMGEFSGSVE
ncbi:acetyl-CoA carboxylase carboxyltransferase subunit alpha [Pontiella sulfatireligans]|uniref:Acetyl-coenzyme A carboxylase carboxyl transferase subunit alpha n=1 Tax=Pontiella sulfatireligans TaxID=2750658 RepID=A0A6C2UH67_9BACT|nr:acetyl-CoA carboxylase carboxyltransferase subunit alpha [Pontiella sulfatireligans]VGO18761.1 Acetyl-coenzyme A carboxylase carboxyl transferase subunit alpha [Pontiella sulfatireligans]